MINIPGTLSVRTLSGRNGIFNIGKLKTSVGSFSVKDASLEQLKEGKYDGDFVIEEIKPYSYFHEGRYVIEIRAYLNSMNLDNKDDLTQDEADKLAPHEQDPLEEEKVSEKTASPTPVPAAEEAPFGMEVHEQKSAASPQPTPAPSMSSEDACLFGTLWPLEESVKLDATVDRQTLRQQTKRLEQLGYELDFKTQTWSRLKAFF